MLSGNGNKEKYRRLRHGQGKGGGTPFLSIDTNSTFSAPSKRTRRSQTQQNRSKSKAKQNRVTGRKSTSTTPDCKADTRTYIPVHRRSRIRHSAAAPKAKAPLILLLQLLPSSRRPLQGASAGFVRFTSLQSNHLHPVTPRPSIHFLHRVRPSTTPLNRSP